MRSAEPASGFVERGTTPGSFYGTSGSVRIRQPQRHPANVASTAALAAVNALAASTPGTGSTSFSPPSGALKVTIPDAARVGQAMSGYAAATVVVEAAYRSGARMQARLALEHGRPVFLLATLLEHDWAREYAQRPGTHVVHDADEVLAALDDVLTPTAGPLVWA